MLDESETFDAGFEAIFGDVMAGVCGANNDDLLAFPFPGVLILDRVQVYTLENVLFAILQQTLIVTRIAIDLLGLECLAFWEYCHCHQSQARGVCR